jgi:photoactive yellow protein
MERFDFQGTDISAVIDRLPSEERNRLPFGVVKLNPAGTILEYNMAEGEISGVHPKDVIGKNFFLDVAVCTQRPEFYGKFRDAMDNNKVLNLIFDYEFQNALYAAVHEPIKVRVHMFSSYEIGGKKIVWLMVKRVGGNRPRPQVVDVAASAAAQLGVPTLGQSATTNMPPMPAQFMPGASPDTQMGARSPMPGGHPQWQPMPPQQAPMQPPPMQQPQWAPQPTTQQPQWAPQPPMQQPQWAQQPPVQPLFQQTPAQQSAAPRASRADETQGADIIIHFDDV